MAALLEVNDKLIFIEAKIKKKLTGSNPVRMLA